VSRENQTPRLQSALLIVVLASAALTLLAVASAASADATVGLDPAPAATAAAAVPVEQAVETAANSAVPAEPAEAPTPTAEPQPAETPEATNVSDSARAAVTSVVDEAVGSTPSNPPRSRSAGAAGRSATAVVDSAVTTLDEDNRQSSGATVEGIRRDLSGTVANVRQSAGKEISALSARLLPNSAGASLSSLLDTSKPASAVMPPSPRLLQTGGETSKDGVLGFLEPLRASLFSSWSPIASDGYTGGDLNLSGFGRVETVEPASHRSGMRSLTATGAGGSGLDADAATPNSRVPAPRNVPLPVPTSPEAIAPGSGNVLFVPFVALLALLALVAPASLRRLWEAPDFRAPTPFVCALERPG
jgi:hypothetical protein